MKLYEVEKYVIVDIIGIILFKIVLDYSYISFVVPYYEYMGFTLDFNLIKYLEGWIVYLVLFALLSRHKQHVLYMTLLISFLLIIVPTVTLYSFKNELSEYFYSMMIPYAGMLLAITTKRIRLHYFPYGKQIAIIVSLFMVVIVFMHYLSTVGIGHINFDILKVYELRSKYGSVSNAGLFGYLNSWATHVFNIFLIAVALLRKKYIFLLFLVLMQTFIFGLSGHKTVVISLLLLAGFYFFDKAKHYSSVIIYTFIAVIIFLLLYFYIFQEQIHLPSLFIRRVFFIPAHLNYVYFDYFSSHDHIYWSNSIFKNIFNYPYEVSPVFVIGDYLEKPEMAANTGIFGSGYMHLGIIGIIIYMFILVIVINLMQQFNKLPIWFLNAVVFMPILTVFISSDLLTTLLTHGLLVAIVIVYLYSSSDENIKRDSV